MLYRMDAILTSSRGKGLEELIKPLHPSPHKLTVISSSRATMHTLLNKAINILAHAPNPHDYHIYIIGGYCDINERISYPLHHLRNIHNRRAQYEEFIFRENQIAAASRVTDLIEKLLTKYILYTPFLSSAPYHHQVSTHGTTFASDNTKQPYSVLPHIPSNAK